MSAAPRKRLRFRQVDAALEADLLGQGLEPWLAQFLAGRVQSRIDVPTLWAPRLADLPHPDAIPDMPRAVSRIVAAIQQGERIVCAVDHDMDGQASAAVLCTALIDAFGVPADAVSVVSSHRLREGYGITPAVVERIFDLGPQLVISADKGSSDEPRIAQLAAAGIDVVVTDHHAVPEAGPPRSALACVNPARLDSPFDPTICGAAVAFFCMVRVRSALLEQGWRSDIPSLTPLLDYVAVATIADCVALRPDSGQLNRTLVQAGLARINARTRPCWDVFCAAQNGATVDSQAVAFQLAPAIAAAGRLDWADTGLDFLRAPTVEAAHRCWSELLEENAQRKAVEKRVRAAAFARLDGRPLGATAVVFLEDGHAGVHGITASRVVERYGRPAAVFAPRGQGDRDLTPVTGAAQDVLTGSFRSIPGCDVRAALQTVDQAEPGLLLGFGGHVGAAGATLRRADFARFCRCFEQACAVQLNPASLAPELWIDGVLPVDQLNLDSVQKLAALDPWGRDFPAPVFAGEFEVAEVRPIGDGTHLRLGLRGVAQAGDARTLPVFAAVWFSARDQAEDALPVATGQRWGWIYQLGANTWQGRTTLQLQILDVCAPQELAVGAGASLRQD